MIVQQRKYRHSACVRIRVLLLVLFFAFSLLCGNMGRVVVPTAAFYDAASVLCELQQAAPALTEGSGESSSAQIVFEELLPVLCFMAHFGLPAASPTALPARAFAAPRRADFWGLIPFSLAPPRLA